MAIHTGGAGADTISAFVNLETDESNSYDGAAGNDSLVGGYLQDSLYGGADNDTIRGNDGSDLIYDTSGTNQLFGDQGDDTITDFGLNSTIYGGTGDDQISSYGGAGFISGDAGDDQIYSGGGAAGVTVTVYAGVGDDIVSAYNAQNYVRLDAGDDYLAFGQGVSTLFGGQGDDVFQGSFDNEQGGTNAVAVGDPIALVYGEAGDDFLFASNGADIYDGGAGEDQVSYTYMLAAVSVNLETNVAGGAATGDSWRRVEDVTGTDFNDTLSGNGAINFIEGGDGNDLIHGGAGGDILEGGIGVDTIDYTDSDLGVKVDLLTNVASGGDAQGDAILDFEKAVGSEFRDVLNGTNAANGLVGADGDDSLSGRLGADTLNGGEGDDKLLGGGDADQLNGSLGADKFIYTALADSTVAALGRDTITDFTRPQGDLIDLAAIDASTLVAGNQAFTFIGAAAYSGVAGQLRYAVTGPNVLVSGDVNGDSVADFGILVSGMASMLNADFIL